ncbi:MAG: DUF4845 domain-containing protein [Halofilum sp. (in: g-proteobacteria)]|nr:DUF4845 domain-containing protein [Halofilum sp. (in: g-proteobacteria)]
MRTPHSQRGISMLSWIAILLVVGFFVLFAMRTVPAYFNYYTLVQVAQGVQQDGSLRDVPVQELRSKLNTRMRINDVDDVGYDAIEIRQGSSGGWLLVVDYEVREPLLLNIDLVMSFNKRIGS